jgi:DHA1 family multidrug resistance protein-like MFS transporter
MPANWRRNLYVMLVAEFAVVMAFNFPSPFMPLFIQSLGSFTGDQTAFWAGIAAGSSGLAMFLTAPLWGIAADRWGRKPMVIRAMLGGALLTALIGLSPNIYYLVAMRFAQGVFTGTIAAASALIAAMAPRNRLAFAMGMLMMAIYGGSTLGPLIGGLLADTFGYRTAFYITAGVLLAAGIAVVILVKESFQRPPAGEFDSLSSLLALARSKEMLPALLVMCALSAGPNIVAVMCPLLFRQLDPAGMVATISGVALALMGVVASVSSYIAGRLSGRFTVTSMMVFCCLGTVALYLPPIWASTATQLTIFIAMTELLKGGLLTSSNALVGLSVSRSRQGIAFGLAQSAQAVGWGLGPALAGSLAAVIGVRYIFGIGAAIYLVVGIIIARMLRSAPKPTAEPASPQP